MKSTRQTVQSWGRAQSTESEIWPVAWRTDDLPAAPGTTFLPQGLGRSYGDVGLNAGGALLDTSWLRHFIRFDPATGALRCEAGVSLGEILRFAVPRGWFLPTTPGTKFVTLGGAIANDVHGKNHHRAGSFGCHVRALELLRSDGTRRTCTPTENADWLAATIGGLGLTGLITWAEIQLRPIQTSYLDTETIRFTKLEKFFAIAEASDDGFEHTVAWIDTSGGNAGRGLFLRGNHCTDTKRYPLSAHRPKPLGMPFEAPNWLLNRWSIRAFNTAYFHQQAARLESSTVHYDSFFYPLDAIANWNRIYGRRGFFQYQCVVPKSAAPETLGALLALIAKTGQASFLSVLKAFGEIPSPGMLSFPRPGITLALDFPNQGEETRKMFEAMDRLVLEAGGAFYPAKDARMSREAFRQSYPKWGPFERFIDPKFSSDFLRRITAEPKPASPG